MKEPKLTDTEIVLMEILWKKERVFMKDILEEYPPKSFIIHHSSLIKLDFIIKI